MFGPMLLKITFSEDGACIGAIGPAWTVWATFRREFWAKSTPVASVKTNKTLSARFSTIFLSSNRSIFDHSLILQSLSFSVTPNLWLFAEPVHSGLRHWATDFLGNTLPMS